MSCEIVELVKEELWNGQITIVCSSWPEDTASMVSLCFRSVVTTFRVMTEGEHKMKALFSYILSTMAGLCLVGGIAVLSGGKE